MIHLAIETSCDETSCAILEDGRKVLSNVISSQIETHRKFGGVVPEIASRMHIESIPFIVDKAFKEANVKIEDIEFISVTRGPGLIGALLVGVSYAKALSYAIKKPIIGANHMLGHIASNYIVHKDLKPPFISLVVSGGHTYLLDVKDYLKYDLIGRTVDDAVGEAFDKVARSLGLNYPGGPEIQKLAVDGDSEKIDFPRVMMKEENYDFSFSGLKTAVLNYLNNEKQHNREINKNDVAASFQKAAVDVLVYKTLKLFKNRNYDKIVLAGGVSANTYLRERFLEKEKEYGYKTYYPENKLCTDNAAMIGSIGYYEYINNNFGDYSFEVDPNLGL